MLYLRAIDQLDPEPIPGTEGAMHAAFSEDGRWLAYTTRTELRKIPIAGGTASTIASNLRMVLGLTWVHSDRVVLSMGGALYSRSRHGGTPAPLFASTAPSGVSRGWPHALGDDVDRLFRVGARFARRRRSLVEETSRAGRSTTLALAGGYPDRHDRGGTRLRYVGRTDDGRTARHDNGAVSGEAAPVLDGVMTGPANAVRATLSSSGTLLYVRGSRDRELVDVGMGGEITALPLRAGAYSHPRLSPDGRHLAVVVAATTGEELRVYDLASGSATIVANATACLLPVVGARGT